MIIKDLVKRRSLDFVYAQVLCANPPFYFLFLFLFLTKISMRELRELGSDAGNIKCGVLTHIRSLTALEQNQGIFQMSSLF